MDRAEFLRTKWLAYPEIPSNSQVYGRIYRLDLHRSPALVEIHQGSEIHKLEFTEIPEILSVLTEGDLVALDGKKELVLLAPALRSLPQNKVDLEILKQWNLFEKALLNFFWERDFLQLRTPSLVTCPGTEPSLDVFSTKLKVGSLTKTLFLPTSPEIHLKKALALGADKIFEVARVYRNGEITERHQPEFLMLEWYRSFSNLRNIQNDVVELVYFLADQLSLPRPGSVQTFSVAELFKIHCNFDIKADTQIPELKELAEQIGVDVRSAETIDDYFFLIFMEKIESQLPHNNLVFVTDYPPYQAALARLTPSGWGDRFEVYWKGLELGNAFHELNDPKIQRLRSAEDLEKKAQMNKEMIDLDEEFFQCLEAGMPPSGGIAMGVERLFMALFDIEDISKVQTFSHSRY